MCACERKAFEVWVIRECENMRQQAGSKIAHLGSNLSAWSMLRNLVQLLIAFENDRLEGPAGVSI